jgi:predicted Zn-dependent peptidase
MPYLKSHISYLKTSFINLKFFTLYILFTGLSLGAFAQSATTSFMVDGIKVIYKPTVKDIVNVSMFYRGGVTNYPAEKAGIEDLALQATTECGTKKYNKNAFKDMQDKYGIDIGGSSGYDYGHIRFQAITKYFNEGWDLFSEAVMNPTFESREVELIKVKQITEIRQSESSPDARVEDLARKQAFENTPYAIDPSGEENIIAKTTAAELKAYYQQILNKNQMFLVVVGKISKEELIEKIKKSFASIPSKAFTAYTYQAPVFKENKLFTEERELATNYLTGIVNAPTMASDEYVPYRLAINILSGNLFTEIRTKRNLSYAPGANTTNLQMPYASVYVSTTSPVESASIMLDQMKVLKMQTVTAESLTNLKNEFFTSSYIKEQSSGALATSLGQAEVLGGWKLAEELPGKINAVSKEQIVAAAQKYIHGINWSYLGDPKLVKTSEVFKISVD